MPPPFPIVLLRHDEPSGGHHFDWMLAVLRGDPARSLLTLRTPVRIDLLTEGASTEAILLPPHRTIYLAHEGPLGGGRGSVTRVASGVLHDIPAGGCLPPEGTAIDLSPTWHASGDQPPHGQHLRIRRLDADRLEVRCLSLRAGG
ncbi:MAG: hypothetical protein KF817_03985 [Phycisphaeraceae bacterium]|nr:hypothetical protein [Phycisphaeraceae bacterium]